MQKIQLFDSALRDGAQAKGISYSLEDKLHMLKVLDDAGMDYIEAGNPASNPKEKAFFVEAAKVKLKNAKLTAFGSTRYKNIDVKEDAGVKALMSANTPVVAIFGKTWDLHVTEVLKTTLEENLDMVRETVAYFKKQGKEVVFDAEHFFDGYKANKTYAMDVLKAACVGGADVVVLCDTNGGAMVHEVKEAVKAKEEEALCKGVVSLHKELMEKDPLAGERIHENDLKRIVRALEVIDQRGENISALQKNRNGLLKKYDVQTSNDFITISLEDKMEAQKYQFKETLTFSNVKIIIKEIYKGSKWDDTAISEIAFYHKGKKLKLVLPE